MDAVLLGTLESVLERWDTASVAYSEFMKYYPDKVSGAEQHAHSRLCALMDTLDRLVLAEKERRAR